MPASLALRAPAPPIPFADLRDHSAAAFQEFCVGYFPEVLGVEVLSVDPRRVRCRAPMRRDGR